MTDRGSDILACSLSHGDRPDFIDSIPALRATAGTWYDHALWLGAASPRAHEAAERLLHEPQGLGIQYLGGWPENRGGHWFMREALALARQRGYKWLLRLDPDVTPKTKRWLKKMVERLDELRSRKGDSFYRFIAAPRLIGLRHPLTPIGVIEDQPYPVEVMEKLGGACRLHPVELLAEFEPNVYDPVGRGDPESLQRYIADVAPGALMLRFPDIRMVHETPAIEARDSPTEAVQRRMSKVWPWLGSAV